MATTCIVVTVPATRNPEEHKYRAKRWIKKATESRGQVALCSGAALRGRECVSWRVLAQFATTHYPSLSVEKELRMETTRPFVWRAGFIQWHAGKARIGYTRWKPCTSTTTTIFCLQQEQNRAVTSGLRSLWDMNDKTRVVLLCVWLSQCYFISILYLKWSDNRNVAQAVMTQLLIWGKRTKTFRYLTLSSKVCANKKQK